MLTFRHLQNFLFLKHWSSRICLFHRLKLAANFEPRSIRNRLTALKKNRAEFIKPSDVNSLYQAVVKQGQYLYIFGYRVKYADGMNSHEVE